MGSADVTELLAASREGDADATDRLLGAVYGELRRIAHAYHARHAIGETLSATSLVHEAYLKLVDDGRLPFDGRAHFFGAAARAMRQVIVDAARARRRDKRGGGARPTPLDDLGTLVAPAPSEEILALDEALQSLETVDPRASRVVECRYFAGLSVEETAGALGISEATVKRDWTTARAWLHRTLAA